jgi:hypothetical protein
LILYASTFVTIPYGTNRAGALGMTVSRAAFLKVCSAALLGVRVDARALLDTGVQRQPARTIEPAAAAGAERFRAQLNTVFAVHTADGANVGFVLAKISERPITKNVEQFSLIFHAPAGTAVSQGTHGFQHHALGNLDLFIVPIGALDSRRAVYQACFSRHLSPSEVGRGQASTASPCRRT